MNSEHRLVEHNILRLLPWFQALVLTILFLGILKAIVSCDGHWIDRSGKVVVAASLLLTFLQFHYENQFAATSTSLSRTVETLVNNKGMSSLEAKGVVLDAIEDSRIRFESVRRQVFLYALASAGIGELVAAFGEIVFASIRQLFL